MIGTPNLQHQLLEYLNVENVDLHKLTSTYLKKNIK